MKPKTKPEPKTSFKLSIPQSAAKAFEATRKEADDLGFDWTATILEQMEKTNTEFAEFLARHRAKVQPEVGPTLGPTNGARRDRASGEYRADE